jgi:hypothetical protein
LDKKALKLAIFLKINRKIQLNLIKSNKFNIVGHKDKIFNDPNIQKAREVFYRNFFMRQFLRKMLDFE